MGYGKGEREGGLREREESERQRKKKTRKIIAFKEFYIYIREVKQSIRRY